MIDLFERASVQHQRSMHPHMGDWSFGGRSADIVNPMRIAKRWNPGLATSTLRPHAKEKKKKKRKKGVGAKDLRDEALGESSVQPSSAPRELVSTGNRWQRLACS